MLRTRPRSPSLYGVLPGSWIITYRANCGHSLRNGPSVCGAVSSAQIIQGSVELTRCEIV